jgi:hypothetical protein
LIRNHDRVTVRLARRGAPAYLEATLQRDDASWRDAY